MTQTWNPAQSGSFLTFSNGNLTVTKNTQLGDDITFGIESFTTGRFYWETLITSTATASTAPGIGNTSSDPTSGNYLGKFADTLGWFGAGGVFVNNITVQTWAAFTSPATLCLALDLVSHTIWGRVGAAGNWNNDVIGNQNPAVGSQVGGLVLAAAIYANPVTPGISLHTLSPADVGTGVFDAASWVGTPPAGFSGFDATAAMAWHARPVSFFR